MTVSSDFIDVKAAASLLLGMDDVLIIMHRDPDGDAVGSGFALWAGLTQLGKNARIVCEDRVPDMYEYLSERYRGALSESPPFSHRHMVTVDAASSEQLGSYGERSGEVDLAVDHHASNTGYARKTLLCSDSASCSEIVYHLLSEMRIQVDEYIASALYTGISTDTGCFRFRNTTAESHRITAKLIESGFDLGLLNRILFETKSKSVLSLQRMVLGSLEYYDGGRIAAVTITREMMLSSGAKEEDMSNISPIARSVEGVEVGLTFRELEGGFIKCSVRTTALADASMICALFGGGGHHGSAGFQCTGDMNEVKGAVIGAVIGELETEKAQ